MGQAKSRGTFAQRVVLAQEEQLRQEPINVPCRTCKALLNGFTLVKTTPAGAAWQKQCECGAVTTAMVQAAYSTLQRTFKSTLGLAHEITGDTKKVSVTFLEKNIDTVESGLIRLPDSLPFSYT